MALGAQGFGGPRSGGTRADVARLAKRLNAFQIDSVNVLARAHYMPAFSRLGTYPMTSIDELAYKRKQLFEFWGHAACYLPIGLYPAFRWRMDQATDARWWKEVPARMKSYVEDVYKAIADSGPMTAGEIPNAGKSKGKWWGWSDGKRAVEILFRQGRVTVADRRNFERIYDITERVIPKKVLGTPLPDPLEARKQLIVAAAKSLGVGTASDIAGYFHIDGWYDRNSGTKGRRSILPALFSELVEAKRLKEAMVEGWDKKAYVAPRTRVPAGSEISRTRALISPFDPIMWERKPTERLFGFEYKIEIYVPAPRRVYGYYVLPFILGDRFAARVDLKADRKNSTLLVPSAWLESGAPAKKVSSALAAELSLLAKWLELERIEVGERGTLARQLARSVR